MSHNNYPSDEKLAEMSIEERAEILDEYTEEARQFGYFQDRGLDDFDPDPYDLDRAEDRYAQQHLGWV